MIFLHVSFLNIMSYLCLTKMSEFNTRGVREASLAYLPGVFYLKQTYPTRRPAYGPRRLSTWSDKTYKLYEIATKNDSDITNNTIILTCY